MVELLPDDDRVARVEKALELVWHIYVRKHTHLGLERPSGVSQHCIPCICAAALGRGLYSGDVSTADFQRELDGLQLETKHE